MRNNILKVSFIFAAITSQCVNAQGCSDAGFCTIDGLKPEYSDSVFGSYTEGETHMFIPKNQIKIGVSTGKADHSILVFGNYIEYSRQFSEKFGMNAKISSLSQQGNEISTFSLSDIFLSGHYQIASKTKATLGVKFPLTDGNQKENNLSLPMDYQASLGTTDLILGLGYQLENWQLTMAMQQPISQNKNQFISEKEPDNSRLKEFQSTNQFKRSGDVLLRVSYPIKMGEKFQITPSILPIYHLANDRYTNISGKEVEIKGSQGLTLNANAYFDYNINAENALQFSLGLPLVVRESRPDGLTRSFVANLEYKFRF